MTTVLFLSPRFPWPLIGGDRVKAYFLLRHLARTKRVILVTFNHGNPPTDEQRYAVESLGIELHSITLKPLVAGASSVRTFWSELPLEIAFYTRPDFQQQVDTIIANNNVDVIISFFMRTAEYVRRIETIPKILIAEDCRVEYQTRSTLSSTNVIQRIVRWWETTKLLRYEPRVVEDFETTTFVSPEDVDAMQDLNDECRYAVVTNGVDLVRFAFVAEQEHRMGVLFVGKLDVQANHLMAVSVINDVFPMVRVMQPGTTLTIAGARPLQSLRSSLSEGQQLLADVPDVVPLLNAHAVFLHPHRGGSGIQNKVLEAMAAGCVVVTTASGLQGIAAVHGEHCLIGVTDTELAEHTVTLLRDPRLRVRLSQQARLLMERTHTWEHVDKQIDAVIVEAIDRFHESIR